VRRKARTLYAEDKEFWPDSLPLTLAAADKLWTSYPERMGATAQSAGRAAAPDSITQRRRTRLGDGSASRGCGHARASLA